MALPKRLCHALVRVRRVEDVLVQIGADRDVGERDILDEHQRIRRELCLGDGVVLELELGWSSDTRVLPLRFDVDRPPFSDGTLHLRIDLTDDDGQTQYHSLDDASVFVVYPADDSRGLVRLEGRWSREESALAAELERA